MRLLFMTLEFSSGAFSGNGIYAQSQVGGRAADVWMVGGIQ